MCVINDPLGQTHSTESKNHYLLLKFVFFREILINGTDGLKDESTDTTCENSDHYRPRPWVDLVDQKSCGEQAAKTAKDSDPHSASGEGHFRQKFFCCISFGNVEICIFKTITGTNDHPCYRTAWCVKKYVLTL